MATSKPTVPALRITSKTAEESRADAVARIPQITDRWTDFNDADLGMVLLTVISSLLEVNRFEADMIASELTIEYTRQRPFGLRLTRLIGYQQSRKVGSRLPLRFSLASPAVKPVTIQPYTSNLASEVRVRGSQSISFVPTQTAVIGVGQTSVDVDAIQGRRSTQSLTSDDSPNQSFILTSLNIAEGTLVIFNNDQVWAQVEHFGDSGPESKHVRVYTDEVDRVHVLLGDGVSGAVPTGEVLAVFVETDGKAGQGIGIGRVSELAATIFDSDGASLSPQPRVTNPEPATGGDDEETLYHAKKMAPREYSAQRRAVTKEDFLAWAEGFGGVKQAGLVQISDFPPDSTEIDYFEVRMPIIPTEGGLPSAALKRALETELERLKVVTDKVVVVDPKFVPIDVFTEIYTIANHEKSQGEIRSDVETAIQSFFEPASAPSGLALLGREPDGLVFGQDVSWSRLLTTIQGVDGVASVSTITPNTDVQVDPDEIAMLAVGSPVVLVLGDL